MRLFGRLWGGQKIKLNNNKRVKKKTFLSAPFIHSVTLCTHTLSPDQNNEKAESVYWIKSKRGENRSRFSFFSAAVSQTHVLDLVWFEREENIGWKENLLPRRNY